jgi:hypothetical protein
LERNVVNRDQLAEAAADVAHVDDDLIFHGSTPVAATSRGHVKEEHEWPRIDTNLHE